MAATIFHESYGTVTRAQLAAYKKYNVSPSDHDMILLQFIESDHEAITQFVKEHSTNGYFRYPLPY